MKKFNLSIIAITAILFFALTSCEDKEIKAKELVNGFVASVANDSACRANYPGIETLNVNIAKAKFTVSDETEVKGDTVVIRTDCNNGIGREVVFFVMKKDGEYKIVDSKGLIAAGNAAIYSFAEATGAYKGENDMEFAKKYKDIKALYDELAGDLMANLEVKADDGAWISVVGDDATLNADVRIINSTGITIKSADVSIEMLEEAWGADGDMPVTGSTTMTITDIPTGPSTYTVTADATCKGGINNVGAFNDMGGTVTKISVEMSDEDKIACMNSYPFTGQEYDDYVAAKGGK